MRRLLLIPVLLAALAACSPPVRTGPAAPTAAATPGDDGVGFARCMRAHGQDVVDPPAGQSVVVPDARTDAQKAAVKACVEFLPSLGRAAPPASAADLEKLRAFAVCMRAHDVPIDDPDANAPQGGKMQIHGRFERMNRAQLDADPGWKSALAACRDRLPDNNPESPNYSGPPAKNGGGR